MIRDNVFEQLRDLIETSEQISLIAHPNPDGDALGSSLAMYHALKASRNLRVIVPNSFPSFLEWMPGSEQIMIFDHQPRQAESFILKSDLIICLDFNTLKRIERIAPIIKASGAKCVLIDHHLEPDPDFDLAISDTRASSTSELVFDVIEKSGYLPDDISSFASCIYVGIMTDTGSFSYSCNHGRPYEITAFLVDNGLDVAHIHNLVYDTFSEGRIRLLGHLLNKRMEVIPEYKAAFISLSLADQERFNYQVGDSEGIVNYALSIQGIRLAAFFTEKSELVRVSLRSKGNLSVNQLARKYYQGGGHKNAAGGNSYTTIRKTEIEFRKILEENKALLQNED